MAPKTYTVSIRAPFMLCDQHADHRYGQGFERHLDHQEVIKEKNPG